MSCGICLSRFNEPVCVPCGHVYCTDCLATHVAATSPDGFAAACPACREPFHTVRPELTCLPKPFHKFALPSLRRVYIDLDAPAPAATPRRPRQPDAARLAQSEARVAALEADKERLLRAGESHAAAARAHARGETLALRKAAELQRELGQARAEGAATAQRLAELREEFRLARVDCVHMEEKLEHTREYLSEFKAERDGAARELEGELASMKVKYTKLKKHCRALEAEAGRKPESDADCTLPLPMPMAQEKKRTADAAEGQGQGSTPKRLRVIRPLPRGPRQSLQMQTPVNFARLEDGAGALGSPFRSGGA
ncbi:hypothetical protein DFH07DRAFT_1017792 [Mycena maculata]|uniref:RING-type domain-containing protein n=1 Tax=Mycena maculata TaxID=230809 RepID=A0AAD7KB40_9AGAR|nr:hypothetical protein DFH07DRAFT_1017792 [Mycena maculata]